jgi:hypothetical protein
VWASAHRRRAGRVGPPIRRWVKPSGGRGGMGFWRPAPPDPMASCSACLSRNQRSRQPTPSRHRVSLPRLRCRRPECAREDAALIARPNFPWPSVVRRVVSR